MKRIIKFDERPQRVFRSTCWRDQKSLIRCAYRSLFDPSRQIETFGFRLYLEVR